jgi:ABC-type polar amino acid transport system ATPase subunit
MAMLDRYRSSPRPAPTDDVGLVDIELIDPTLAAPEERDAPPAIELRHVSTFFGQFCALDDVNLVVEPGRVVGIIGPSGSGKSTLVRTINQLCPQSLGEVKVFGVEVTDNRYDLRMLRQTVGMVFQDFNLFPQFSVLNNVTVALRLVRSLNASEAEELAMNALRRVSMARHAEKRPDQLSGGEQQRVAIARAIAAEPSILLLDEPTASIDPELTKGLMQTVTEIAATDVTVVIVTHELGFVRSVADALVVLDAGSIIEEGPPAEVLRRPQHERTRRFLADVRHVGTRRAGNGDLLP